MTTKNEPRQIRARRLLTLGGMAATLAAPIAPGTATAATAVSALRLPAGHVTAAPGFQKISSDVASPEGGEGGEGGEHATKKIVKSSEGGEGGEGGEQATKKVSSDVAQPGGGEGEGASGLPGDVSFLRNLGFLSGHLRVGLALLKAKDASAARIHMNHPIEEKYAEVADELNKLGFGDLKGDLLALSKATDAGRPLPEIEKLYNTAIARIDAASAAVHTDGKDRLMALVELGRVAAGDYAAGVDNGMIVDLAEYQDSWGFIEAVKAETNALANSEEADLKAAALKFQELLNGLAPAYGDLQGNGIKEYDPSLIYSAMARMEIIAIGVK